MSWIRKATSLRTPMIPNCTIGDTIWIGAGADAGFYLFINKSKWIISKTLGPVYSVSGSEFATAWHPVNYYVYFAKYGLALWMDNHGQWIINNTPGWGTREEWVWLDEDDHDKGGKYQGDCWYSGSLPDIDKENEFAARGNQRGAVENEYKGTPLKVSCAWDYWEHDSESGNAPAGIYTLKDEDDKIVGLPSFKGDDNKTYIRSMIKIDEHYTYDDGIHYDEENKKWIIGTVDSSTGWWEGAEPKINGSVVYKFKKPDDSDITGKDIKISFDKYVLGDHAETRYLTEAPIWL